jgi:hypothetical protein
MMEPGRVKARKPLRDCSAIALLLIASSQPPLLFLEVSWLLGYSRDLQPLRGNSLPHLGVWNVS